MRRLPDWPVRLHDFVDGVKRSPFKWETHDCWLGWAADAAIAIIGVDIGADYRGQYSNAIEAARVMKKAGFSNLADLVASHLPEIHVSQAKIGDIAAIADDTPFGFTLGIINGETILVLGEQCMGVELLSRAARVFQVGQVG